jgi:hypothetical protein
MQLLDDSQTFAFCQGQKAKLLLFVPKDKVSPQLSPTHLGARTDWMETSIQWPFDKTMESQTRLLCTMNADTYKDQHRKRLDIMNNGDSMARLLCSLAHAQ